MKINEKNLCAFALQEPYDKCGFLLKRGEVNKAFLKRFFILKGNLLFYFEKKPFESRSEPIGMIILEGCLVELADLSLSEMHQPFCFCIRFHGENHRNYYLAAETQMEMEGWMKSLTCASYDYIRLMVAELKRKLAELERSQSNHAPPLAPPRRQAPARPKTASTFSSTVPAKGGDSDFESIHQKIGGPILEEISAFEKKKTNVDQTKTAASKTNESNLISF